MSASAISFSRSLLRTSLPARKRSRSSKWFRTFTVSTLVAGSAIYIYQQDQSSGDNHHKNNGNSNTGKLLFAGAAGLNVASKNEKTFKDYQKVYNDIAQKLIDDDDYDDGSYGPVLVRLAWHSAGTFKSDDNTGGPYGGTMRFEKEAKDPGNNGLANGRQFLEEFKAKYPWLSYGDLWTLGGVVGVQELNGPKVKWRPGRKDVPESKVPPNGRLPDGSKGADHVRDVFVKRMNFSDRETVAIIGAHVLGRCHKQYSGFDGPWQENPTYFSNAFFTKLLENWHVRPNWDGNKQYEDDKSKSLMMLPTDIALKEDSAFLKYVKLYASNEKVFFDDFSKAFQKLLELGIEFPSGTPEFTFKTLDEQS